MLENMTVDFGYVATGIVPTPLQALEARSAQLRAAPLPLEDASEQTKMKMKLEQARQWSEAQIWKAKQAVQILNSEPAPSAARRTIRDCLKDAVALSSDNSQKLDAECSKWLTAKMNVDDSIAIKDLIDKAKSHLENLTEWTKVALQKKP